MLGILLTCLFLVAQSGHIYPQDIQINPNNKNTPSDITLVFSLDTSLAPTDYLRIIFPFRLNSVQPALWDQYINCTFNTTTNKRAIVTASTLSGDSTSYFVQFYTDLTTTTLSNLNSSVVYYLKITGTPDPSAQTGLNSPVQLLTVSNNKGNWVIYDSNSVFGTLTLADAYPSTMTVSVTVPSTQVDSTVLGNSYTIRVDITPKKTLTGRARVDIQFTNTDFSLLTCKSINSTSEGISLLPATFLSLNTYTIRATISKTLTAGNGAKYRFECTVRNPANTGTTKIIVKNRMGYTETIAESGTDSVGLTASTTTSSSTTTTSGWEEASHQVLLGWGYPAHLSGALSIFSLYKDASPTERWYQSVKTVFKPKAGLIATDNIQVVISTVNDASFKILTASIYHNLPSLNASNPVSCSVVTQGYLTCSNVGTLAAQQYWVSFRFNLLSTATVNTVSDFGKVRVQTQATSPVVLIALSITTLANKVVKTNVALYTSSSTNGVIAYSTTKTGSTTTKYVTNGENVILKFAFKYFTNTFIPLSTANIERGIEFYTSQALAASTSPTCSISGLTQTTDILITNCAVEALTSFSRLRFRIQKFARVNSGTPPYAQFTSTAQDGTIFFDYVQFGASQFSSLNYVNENVFDYYARWVQDFTAATNPSINIATGSSSFFFNSLVYKNGGLSNVQVGTTFFVTGASASDASNDGTSFPTLIRVTGYLATGTIDEQTGTTRLLLFFNDLEPLNTVTPCFGPTGIACNYVANGVENTQTDSLTDYSGSRRIEIQIDPTQRFNIYIPVKTISQKTSIGFFVTTASTIDATQGIFATRYSKRINQVTSTMTTLAIDPVGSTPKVSVTGTPTMGSAIDTSITGITSSYVPSAANTGSLIGAAYGYCANFDFTATSGFTFKPFYTSSATPEQYCVSIKYSPTTSKDVTCHVCPVHSTMPASNAAVTKFTLPTMAGQDFYDLVYVVGNNNGDFLKAAKDNQATVMAAKTLSGLGITFTPTVFKKANKNVYARVNFTASIPLPKNIRINITPTGSSTSLLVLPVSTVSCNVLTTTATSCVTSGSATNIQIDAVAQGSTWAAGGHAIDFMIDASTAAASISADAVINFAATIKVDGITALSALHHSSPASPPTFTIKNQASNYIGLYNISYLFGNKNARSVISFVFELPNDIKVYPAQTIVFNLGGIATANVGETPICFVRDYTTQIVSNDFASCDVSDLTQLTLQAKATVTGNYTVELQFIHIPSSAAPAGISAKVLAADGSTIVAQNLPSSPLTLPQTPSSSLIPALNVNLNRLYSDPGNVAEVVLSIRPSVKAVAIATHLYLYFPTYYADKLGYQNIWCIANNLPVQCSIMGSRIVHLSSFPVEVAVGSVLTIRVYGVITPVVPSPAGKIFIGLADSDNVFQLTEQLEVTDITSSASFPTALTIDTFSATTQKIRETADYTIAFTTDAVGIRTTRKITIDFPDRYGNILGGIDAPTILLSKTGNTTTTSIQAASIGSRFKITPPYDLDPKTSYTFVIKGIDNPEDSTCYMDKPMISITDSTESVAISRTAPNIWNVPNMDYTTDASLKALSWVDTSGNPVTMLLLSIGIFSQEIRIVPPSTPGTFGSDITFSQSQAALTLLPDSLSATKGTPYLSLRVSATSSTFPRIILLDLNKDESYTTNIYSELPKLQLVLTNNKNTLPTNAIRIVQGGTSLPYSWDLEALDLIPNTELKMDVSINQPTLSPLSVLGASSISFGPSTTQAGFTFTLSSTADPTSPPSFTVVLGGTDSNNYQLYNSTVTVTVESPNTVAPVLSEYTPTLNYGPTTQQFGLKTDQMASVYWHVAYEGKLTTTDCLRVRSKYNEGVSFDSSSPTQAQYGVFYVYTENVVSNQVVKNLLSHEVYSYVLCPANQLDYMGANTTGTFTTKDNLSRLAKVSITFTQALTTTQLTSLVCLFKKEFQLPDLNAVAMDGTTCLTSSVLDDKSVFDYKTLEIYLNGDRSSVFDSSMITNLAISVQNVSTQTASTFLTTFNQGLRGAGLTGLYQSIALETGITYSLPTFPSTDYKPSTTIFDTKVNLYGLQLSSGPGFFYAIATEDTTVVPTQAEIKAKLNGKDTTSPGGNVMYNSDSANITLTGLTADTDYLVYYYASTADRTQYVRVTDVNVIKVRTKPTIDSLGHSRMEMSIAMVTFMTVIAWLF